MKILALLALLLFCAAPALAQTAPEENIVGQWQGIGMNFLTGFVFEKNHTWHDTEDRSTAGTWSYQNGQFLLAGGEVSFKGTIDSEDRLILSHSEGPEIKFAFRRKGAVAAQPTPSATLALTTATLAGEWRFAYPKKSSIAAAPPFDTILFTSTSTNRVRLGFAPFGRQFTVDSAMAREVLALRAGTPPDLAQMMSFLPLGMQAPAIMMFTLRLEAGGKLLVITNRQASEPFKCEWAFMRPADFPPNDLTGTWIAQRGGMTQEIEMRKDGACLLRANGMQPVAPAAQAGRAQSGRPGEYYRLWRSPLGNVLTLVTVDPEMQLHHAAMLRYEKKGDELILTPLEMEFGEQLEPVERAREVWKLKRTP